MASLDARPDSAKRKIGYGLALAGWLCSVLAAAAVLAALQLRGEQVRFVEVSQALLRALSQRTGQHDVALTSLSAFASQERLMDDASVLQPLGESLKKFYPRILAIEVVRLQPAAERLFRSGPASLETEEGIFPRLRAMRPGQSRAEAIAGGAFYRILKRSSGAGKAGLVLTVDLASMLTPPTAFASASRIELRLDGSAIFTSGSTPKEAGPGVWRLAFARNLASQSQPFELRTTRRVAFADLLPVWPLAAIAALLAALWGMGWTIFRQRRDADAARQAARLKEYEARMAHASRVNAMGELASGIAHELAQPLTSLLSQTQAGARLARAEPMDKPAVLAAFDSSARMARRAGDILTRLRAYVSKTPQHKTSIDVAEACRSVIALLASDLAESGVAVSLEEPSAPALAFAERIGVEQIVHNLLRNAADALTLVSRTNRQITIAISRNDGDIRISICDNGPGIAPDVLARIFEPFFTTRDKGMGLGLALCERLARDNDGQILAENRPGGGACFTFKLPEAQRNPSV